MLTLLIGIGAVALAGLVGLLLYWQLVVAEGAYLGTRVVALLYDWFAPRYDKTKRFDPTNDAIMLAWPIMQHLADARRKTQDNHPSSVFRLSSFVILDVATGTGRLPEVLLTQPNFRGHIVALDASGKMLACAQQKLVPYADRLTWMRQDAQDLPFDDNRFDVVTCLEALEFILDWRAAVCEMVRVLKPGGLLMITNRIGPDAWKLPGRAISTPEFSKWLQKIGLDCVESKSWLVDYDLVTAIKSHD